MTKHIGMVVCAAVGMNLLAAAPTKPVAKVEVLFDRPDGLYQKGEKVTFVTKVTNPDGTPATNGAVTVSLSNWGGKSLAAEKFDLAKTANGQKAYRGVGTMKAVSLDEPGFIRCVAHYVAPDQDIWGGEAVAVSPRAIRNGTPRPKDFDKFWDDAIANLDKTVPADVRCEKDEKFSTKTHTCFRLSCATYGERRRTWGFLAVPNEGVAGKAKFPVRLTVLGAGPGCYWWSPKEGAITLTMNVFDFEPGWNLHVDWKAHYERYNEMHKRWGAKFGTREAWPAGMGSKVEDSFYYGAILGVNRLVNWLCAQQYVDRSDVTYSGQSQGGAFGIYLASLNTNLTAATISQPALTGLTMHRANRNDGWPNPYACHTNDAQRAVVEKVAPYLDGVNFTPRIKCRVRFGVGFIDQLCPPHCVYAAYNNLNPIVDRRMVNGLGVGHGSPKETYEPFAKRLEESWKKAKPIGGASAATIVENGKSEYAIRAGESPRERVAAVELQEIFEKSTGVRLEIVSNAVNGAAGVRALPERRIYVGYTPEAEAAFGKDTLGANEYAMTEKDGGDIWLRGTGHGGTMLAVYRFCEDVLGYRCFIPEPDCERILKHGVVKTDGKGFRAIEHFPMGRGLTHTFLYGVDRKILAEFMFRNGSGCPTRWLEKTQYRGLKGAIDGKDSGHGFFLYMPCERCYMDTYPWDERIDFFEQHPEWYSMNAAGQRTDRMQLCFSNPELRKAFTKRVLERCRRVGGDGVLTIGAQDVPGAFCFCPECQALAKKYGTPAGPYWDFLPELCAAIGREYPKICITTLAYRKEQSENFPKGIEKFPDNFICDFAPVDDNQSFNIGGKGNEKTLDNLRKWCKACKTVLYWYYACSKHPYGLVSRPTGDLRAMDAAGTDETKLCGLYAPGFGPMLDYLFLRQARDPQGDPWIHVKEFCDGIYGAASADVQALAHELDEVWFRPTTFVSIDVPATALQCYKPEDILRWQKMLDVAERKVAGDAKAMRWLSLVRWDIDMLTLQFWRDMRKEVEKAGGQRITPDSVYERMKKVVHQARYQSRPESAKGDATGLYAQAKNAYLVALALDKPLPAPLDRLPADQIVQIPQCGGHYGVVDPDAACGRAKSCVYKPGSAIFTNSLVTFDYYDNNARRWIVKGGRFSVKGFRPGEYKAYLVGKFRILPASSIEIEDWWGIGQGLGNYYPEGDADREFELWASLKFVGPEFGTKTEDGRSRMVCDRFFLIDKNGKKYKGEETGTPTPKHLLTIPPGENNPRNSEGDFAVLKDGSSTPIRAIRRRAARTMPRPALPRSTRPTAARPGRRSTR